MKFKILNVWINTYLSERFDVIKWSDIWIKMAAHVACVLIIFTVISVRYFKISLYIIL